MNFPFNKEKTIQACALLMKEDPQCKKDKIRLVKLLYMADRESLKEFGDPITDDEIYAMPEGPAGTNTVDQLGKGAEWREYIQTKGEHGLELVQDPGRDLLSEVEFNKLKEIAQDHKDDRTWEIVESTHQFEEYVKNDPHHDPEKDSKPIPFEDILESLGLSDFEKEYKEMKNEFKAMEEVKKADTSCNSIPEILSK